MTARFAGRPNDAQAAYRRVEMILSAHPAATDDDRAPLAHNLGGLAFILGDWDGAETQTRRAIELRTRSAGAHERRLGRDSRELATPLDNLSAVLEAQGRAAEAAALADRRRGYGVPEATERQGTTRSASGGAASHGDVRIDPIQASTPLAEG